MNIRARVRALTAKLKSPGEPDVVDRYFDYRSIAGESNTNKDDRWFNC